MAVYKVNGKFVDANGNPVDAPKDEQASQDAPQPPHAPFSGTEQAESANDAPKRSKRTISAPKDKDNE